MRLHSAAVIATLYVAVSGMAYGAPPTEIGNRANGFSYQPTPSEVVPRERSAGVQPSAAREKAENQDLERMDADLLREEGLSTKSVPNLTAD
ncbi:MAG: hypothetical protein QOH05_696 [Acetobacteraceae bacterium]|jgi:hypothetical protein|nr:hypothetical protein [Acetobacteraceae bacterium]